MFKALANAVGESSGWNAAVQTGKTGNRLFDYIDKRDGCKNGVLQWNEFVPFLAQVGWNVQMAQQAWNEADKDRSGYLTRSEFIRFCNFSHVHMYIMQIEARLTGSTGSGIRGINVSANTVGAMTGYANLAPPGGYAQPAVAVVPIQTYVQPAAMAYQPYGQQPMGYAPAPQPMYQQPMMQTYAQPAYQQPMMQPYQQPMMQQNMGAYGEATGMNAMMYNGQIGNRLFDYIDSRNGCRNGTLSWMEFVPFLTQMGWNIQDAQMQWWQADIDRSGFLSRSEFIRFANFPMVRQYIQQVEATLTGASGTGIPGVNVAPAYGYPAPMMGGPATGYGSPYY